MRFTTDILVPFPVAAINLINKNTIEQGFCHLETVKLDCVMTVAPISLQAYLILPMGTSFYNVSTPSTVRGHVALRMSQENTRHKRAYIRLTLYITRPSMVVKSITSVFRAMTRRT